jgi:flagellar FliL protein
VSKKLIIIIVAVLLLLGGAGAGYYFFMHKDEPASEHEDTEHGEADKKKASKKSADKSAKESEHDSDTKNSAEAKEPMYLDLMMPMIVNFPKGSGASLIQVSVSFLTDSEETVTSLKKHEPMLRNNLMMKVNAQNPENLKTKAGKEVLRTVMLEEVNQILSKVAEGGRVKEVFFTAFVMQ